MIVPRYAMSPLYVPGDPLPVLRQMPDAEECIRQWVKTIRFPEVPFVAYGVPADPTFPIITLARIGGQPDATIAVDYPLVSFNVWHGGGSIGGKAETHAIAAVLAAAVNQTVETYVEVDGVWSRIAGGTVTLGPLWRPDPTAHRPRYVVDATFTLTPGHDPGDIEVFP